MYVPIEMLEEIVSAWDHQQEVVHKLTVSNDSLGSSIKEEKLMTVCKFLCLVFSRKVGACGNGYWS